MLHVERDRKFAAMQVALQAELAITDRRRILALDLDDLRAVIPRMRVATGPATTQVKSRMRTPSSGIAHMIGSLLRRRAPRSLQEPSRVVAQNFAGMLTDQRRTPRDAPRRAVEKIRRARVTEVAAELGMLDFDEVAALD